MPADQFADTDTLTIEGSEALKSLGEEGGKIRVGAYAIRFGKSTEPDLTGEYFTAKTDFGPNCGNGVATMVNHGIPLAKDVKALADVAEMTFGAVKTTRDEIGIFVETCLDISERYQKAIADLCAQGKLRWSSGSSPHIARKNADGEITRWHPIEFSFTPKAAEPRLPAIRPLKSLPEDAAPEITAAFVDTPKAAEPAQKAPIKTTIKIMAESASPTDEQKIRDAEIKEMKAVATHFKCVEIGEDFVHLGKSLNELRTHIAEHVVKARPVQTSPLLNADKKEIKSWSFLKAVREIAHGGGTHALTGVEKDMSEATSSAIKKTPKGFFIPHDVIISNMAETHDLGANAIKALLQEMIAIKTLNATTFGSGGALVGTSLLTGSMIELLRNKPLVAQMGARTLSGLVGNIAIPTINGGASAYWLSEQGQATNSDQSFGQLGLVPRKLVGRTGYTKELMNQTDISVEALVRDDLTTILSIAKDLAALNGAGGAEPIGIINTTGINSVTFSTAATRQKATDFQKEVAVDNASRGALAYLTTPTVAGKWMNIAEASNYPQWLWQGNIDQGTVVGRPSFSTNQVPSDKVIYGNWNDLILADWAGMDVVVNPYTGDATGVVTITITLWSDTGIRHAVSFCVSTDSGAQ